MATDPVQTITLAIILGTLIAIVYSLRILVLLERRIARMDHHVELMAMSILKDEKRLLDDEKKLEKLIKSALGKKSSSKKSSSKKSSKKSSSKKSSSKKSSKKKSKK